MFLSIKIWKHNFLFPHIEPTGIMADYANLPKDMLQEITKFLSFKDTIKFGVICSQWYHGKRETPLFSKTTSLIAFL